MKIYWISHKINFILSCANLERFYMVYFIAYVIDVTELDTLRGKIIIVEWWKL